MSFISTLRHARISPQKCRLVADLIRGMKVEQAKNVLDFCQKKGAVLIKKVLDTAIANAQQVEYVDIDELRVSEIFVCEGPRLKRFAARAKGRGNRILKRTSHITVKVAAA